VYGLDNEKMADAAWSVIPEETKQEARDFMEWRYGETKGTKAQFYLDQGASVEVAKQQADAKRAEVRYGLSEKAFIVCDSFKRLWRNAHSNTTAWWKELNEAARRAILSPGVTVPARSVKFRKDGSWLRCLLPSGRYLCYPFPQVDDHGQVSFMGVNQFNRKWCRIKTYGGKLAENITQASARDVFAHAMPLLEDAGYPIVLGVHDENITETPDEAQYSAEEVARIMSIVPPWCAGLPLAAAGFETYRYRKE
jgi:DNA polymerase